jgi:Ca2+-binding RTX toxin-like protein
MPRRASPSTWRYCPQNTGGAGIDTLSSIEGSSARTSTTLTGDAGNNVLGGLDGDDLLNGGAGDDILVGGDGNDTASYADAASAVTVSLAIAAAQNTGGAGTDTLIAIENLTGSNFNDTRTGNGVANSLNGGAGRHVERQGRRRQSVGWGRQRTLNGGVGDDNLQVERAMTR